MEETIKNEEMEVNTISEKQTPVTNENVTTNSKRNAFAVCSLVLGCISLISWLLPIIGYITSIIAFVFGCVSASKPKSSMATVGIVMSCVGFGLSLINSILGVIFFA